MSKSKPIHYPQREIRTHPDESEPVHSYEEPSILLGRREDQVEEDFHQRYASNVKSRHGSGQQAVSSGGSFWRTGSETDRSSDRPAFSSMAMTPKESPITLRARKKTGLLGNAKSQENPETPRRMSDANGEGSSTVCCLQSRALIARIEMGAVKCSYFLTFVTVFCCFATGLLARKGFICVDKFEWI